MVYLPRPHAAPKFVDYHLNGTALVEEWHESDVQGIPGEPPHRVERYEDGAIKVAMWIKDGEVHRENGKPAYVRYTRSGKVLEEEYHGDEGVTTILYDAVGIASVRARTWGEISELPDR